VAFVATLTGVASHDIVAQALTALRNLDHRGAAGAEVNSGDGAGILMQVPDAFLREAARDAGFELPAKSAYAVGTAFLPGDEGQVTKTRGRIEEIAAEEGLAVLGWREVPINPEILGKTALGVMPTFSQLFVAGAGSRLTGMALERLAYCLRRRSEKETDVYFPSLSSRTLAYKGMLTTDQLDNFFPDLTDERVASALAVVHSRFSTNTFPSWPLAHPFGLFAKKGDINTVLGNGNWLRARVALLSSEVIPGDV
jgi:glutamate synthase (NADPH/NADH) large chain